MGGGAPVVSAEASLGLLGGKGGGVSVALLSPNDKADLLGGSGFEGSCSVELCRAGRGGREGRTGGGWILFSSVFDTTLGEECVAFKAVLAGLGSSLAFFGGRGGNLEGSYGGAFILNTCPSPKYDALLTPVWVDPTDSEERPDAVVDTDSADSRLLMLCSEDLRGGRLGAC